MTEASGRRYILAIFVLGLVFRLAYAIVTPAFEAPDEYAHYSYVRFLHESDRLPVQSTPVARREELEFHQPPLYYLLLAPLFPSTYLVDGRPALPLRLVSILFAMLTMWVAYQFGKTTFPKNPFAMNVLCVAVALIPTYSYTSSTIRNGVLATLLASCGFYVLARAVVEEHGVDPRRWFFIGALGGLSVIAKLSSIGFLAAGAVALVTLSREWRTLWRRSLWFLSGAIVVGGWWFIRNWLVYGSWLRVVESGFESAHRSMAFGQHAKAIFVTLFKTFWAVFGQINEYHFADIYRFYWWFAGLALLGLARYAFGRRDDVPDRLLGILAAAIAVSLMSTLYYAYRYDSDQGRYLFPVLIPIATFIALGFNAIVPTRFQRWALDTILFIFAGINVLSLSRLAVFYRP